MSNSSIGNGINITNNFYGAGIRPNPTASVLGAATPSVAPSLLGLRTPNLMPSFGVAPASIAASKALPSLPTATTGTASPVSFALGGASAPSAPVAKSKAPVANPFAQPAASTPSFSLGNPTPAQPTLGLGTPGIGGTSPFSRVQPALAAPQKPQPQAAKTTNNSDNMLLKLAMMIFALAQGVKNNNSDNTTQAAKEKPASNNDNQSLLKQFIEALQGLRSEASQNDSKPNLSIGEPSNAKDSGSSGNTEPGTSDPAEIRITQMINVLEGGNNKTDTQKDSASQASKTEEKATSKSKSNTTGKQTSNKSKTTNKTMTKTSTKTAA